jgi:hypothetical protein
MDGLYLGLGILVLWGYHRLQMCYWYRRELTDVEARVWNEDPVEATMIGDDLPPRAAKNPTHSGPRALRINVITRGER